MSSSRSIARSLNSWAREAQGMLGGADADAIAELVADFMTTPDEETDSLGSKRS